MIGGIAGFVKVDAGAAPSRTTRRIGAEHVMVLQGGFTDEDGRDYVAGDDSHMAAGTGMANRCIYLAVIRGKVDVGLGFISRAYAALSLLPA